jgi:hypothetical protein
MSQSDSHMDIISPRSMCSWNQLLLARQCHGSSYMQQMLSRRLKCCLQNETPKKTILLQMPSALVDLLQDLPQD